MDLTAGHELTKGGGSVITTAPLAAVALAELPAFGRVDADQADILAVQFDGIAVDHAGRLCGGPRPLPEPRRSRGWRPFCYH